MNAKTAFVPLLTNRQKASLCQMARQAWIEAGSALDFSDWRRQQQLKVVGKASLTQCNQDDYRPLANHFVAIKNGAEPDRKGRPPRLVHISTTAKNYRSTQELICMSQKTKVSEGGDERESNGTDENN